MKLNIKDIKDLGFKRVEDENGKEKYTLEIEKVGVFEYDVVNSKNSTGILKYINEYITGTYQSTHIRNYFTIADFAKEMLQMISEERLRQGRLQMDKHWRDKIISEMDIFKEWIRK